MQLTLPIALDVLADVLGAVLYFAVARLVASRPVEAAAVGARQAFSAWWNVLGVLSLYGVFADGVTLAGRWTVPLLLASTQVLLLVILLALAALMYYLIYLYTGRQAAWKPILAFYGLFWALFVYYIESLQPNGIDAGAITPMLHYAHDPKADWFAPLLGLLLILPLIGAAVGYFTLFFRAREPTQRYRIAVVSLSLVLWFTFSLVGGLVGVSQALFWIVLSRVVSLAAAGCVYAAYRPPRWVQRKWGVQGIAAR